MAREAWTRRAFIETGCAAALTGFVGCSTRVTTPSRRGASGAGGGPPPIGVCRGPDEAGAVAAAGGIFIEVSCRRWLVPEASQDQFEGNLRQLREAAVPATAANGFLPGSLPCVGPDADAQRTLDYASVVFERAEAAGIRTITFGSGAARRIPPGWPLPDAEQQFVDLLARMAPIAERHRIMVCVEPLQKSETNMINRVSEARRLVTAVQHPHVGITADVFHMMREDEPATSIIEAGALVRHVHIAEKQSRTAPGVAGDDFRPYLRALREIDYGGAISIECRWDDLPDELPAAIATLQAQWVSG